MDRHLYRASTRSKICYKEHLTKQELELITTFAQQGSKAAMIRQCLTLAFPSRIYDYDLIKNLQRAALVAYHGGDSDMMNKFIKLGDKINASGGIFKFAASIDRQLTDVFICLPEMMNYVKEYNDYITEDGSHGMNKFDQQTMISNCVDSLLRTCPVAVSIGPSENSSHLITKYEVTKVGQKGSSYMTDGGSAFPPAAEKLEMVGY
jgi:hypothetical protein